MNALITRYKKMVLLAVAVAAMSISSAMFAVCTPCQAAAAIRQSIKDAAAAAALLAGKPNSREAELDEIPAQDSSRAPREALTDPCSTSIGESGCSLDCKLQALFNCCVNTNQQLRCQAHAAEKCCKKLSHKIDDVDDGVAGGFSVVEGLILSQTDAAAICCSVMEGQITALSASVADVFALLTSVFDCTCT